METINCPRCGKLFLKFIEPICPPCVKEEEEIFERVRLYVKEHPNCSIKEASDACDVPVKRILKYIRDGKLEASHGMAGEITCGKCGKPILIGRMCDICANEASSQVKTMKEQVQGKKSPRVYTQ